MVYRLVFLFVRCFSLRKRNFQGWCIKIFVLVRTQSDNSVRTSPSHRCLSGIESWQSFSSGTGEDDCPSSGIRQEQGVHPPSSLSTWFKSPLILRNLRRNKLLLPTIFSFFPQCPLKVVLTAGSFHLVYRKQNTILLQVWFNTSTQSVNAIFVENFHSHRLLLPLMVSDT